MYQKRLKMSSECDLELQNAPETTKIHLFPPKITQNPAKFLIFETSDRGLQMVLFDVHELLPLVQRRHC